MGSEIGFSPALNEKRKTSHLSRNVFLSAGARTRTWSNMKTEQAKNL